MIIRWIYIALNRTPSIDCYWVGAVPNLKPEELRVAVVCSRLNGYLEGQGGLGDSGTENGNCTNIIKGLGAGDLVSRLTMEPY